jgi:hypothetical protein
VPAKSSRCSLVEIAAFILSQTLSSKIIEPPPTLRHSGQAQRRSGTHAVDGGEANRVQHSCPPPPCGEGLGVGVRRSRSAKTLHHQDSSPHSNRWHHGCSGALRGASCTKRARFHSSPSNKSILPLTITTVHGMGSGSALRLSGMTKVREIK